MINVRSYDFENDRGTIPLPKLISSWAELAKCESLTHILDIDIKGCNGWIRSKKDEDDNNHNDYYLSTHTFYGNNYQNSTKILQECGFNVVIANWDT